MATAYVNRVVLQQALLLALAGFVPGLLRGEGVYALTRHFARLPIAMTWQTAGLVLGLVVVMCTGVGIPGAAKGAGRRSGGFVLVLIPRSQALPGNGLLARLCLALNSNARRSLAAVRSQAEPGNESK